MKDRLTQIEKDLELIKIRNMRVEQDKAWEVSLFRRGFILTITYIIASLVMFKIGIANYYLNALIPTVGYLLSTLSLPLLKKWWINRN